MNNTDKLNSIPVGGRGSSKALAVTAFELNIHIGYFESFIRVNEKSRFNPMYYLYYPAKASVASSKEQLKGYKSVLKAFYNE